MWSRQLLTVSLTERDLYDFYSQDIDNLLNFHLESFIYA